MRDRQARGFTIAEIMLVIVVGFFLMYSATTMYLMAKDSSAVSKAREKVLSVQQLAEQLAIQSGGSYPEIYVLAQAWQDKRPNDFDKSPWGGQVRIGFQPSQAITTSQDTKVYLGITGRGGTNAHAYQSAFQDVLPGHYRQNDAIIQMAEPVAGGAIEDRSGVIEYYRIDPTTQLGATASFFDFLTNRQVEVRGFGVAIRNLKNQPIFWNGGAPPPGG